MSKYTAEQAKAAEIITRVVRNSISILHTRNLVGVTDGADIPSEDELINDALGIALDEDIGCGDESELCEENSDLIWLTNQLKPISGISAASSTPEDGFEKWWSEEVRLGRVSEWSDTYTAKKAFAARTWNAAKSEGVR